MYSSSANGIAECKHGITFSMVRVILHNLGLPDSLWALVATYAVYMLNLMPAAQNGFQIPVEVFSGQRQDVSHLQPFGVKGWTTIVNDKGGKTDMRAVKGRMVGYGE